MSINSKRGFSLPELLITLAVGLILAGTGILLASTATNQIRLSTSGTNYANLCRMRRASGPGQRLLLRACRLRHLRLGRPLQRVHSSPSLYRH